MLIRIPGEPEEVRLFVKWPGPKVFSFLYIKLFNCALEFLYQEYIYSFFHFADFCQPPSTPSENMQSGGRRRRDPLTGFIFINAHFEATTFSPSSAFEILFERPSLM